MQFLVGFGCAIACFILAIVVTAVVIIGPKGMNVAKFFWK